MRARIHEGVAVGDRWGVVGVGTAESLGRMVGSSVGRSRGGLGLVGAVAGSRKRTGVGVGGVAGAVAVIVTARVVCGGGWSDGGRIHWPGVIIRAIGVADEFAGFGNVGCGGGIG